VSSLQSGARMKPSSAVTIWDTVHGLRLVVADTRELHYFELGAKQGRSLIFHEFLPPLTRSVLTVRVVRT
jgi:hypothetical protein